MKFIFRSEEQDLPFEDELEKDPFAPSLWWAYIGSIDRRDVERRSVLYERALRKVSGSYKLWFNYLTEVVQYVRGFPAAHPSFSAVNKLFERALVFMSKMPRIWLLYLEFLWMQKRVTSMRKALNEALRVLPRTQHSRIWDYVIYEIIIPDSTRDVRIFPIRTSKYIFTRYLILQPKKIEDYIDFLETVGDFDEACFQLAGIINDPRITSRKGRNKQELWDDMCQMMVENASMISSFDVDGTFRRGIRIYHDNVAHLWCSLAEYYIRLARFETATSIFEEALRSVISVNDFGTVFEAYTKFLEGYASAGIESLHEENESIKSLESLLNSSSIDVDYRLDKLQLLLDRRQLMVNELQLRLNPDNCTEWRKRAELYRERGDDRSANETLAKAIASVNPQKAVGNFQILWVELAKQHEASGEVEIARKLLKKATKTSFRDNRELVNIWCEIAELELRHGYLTAAREVVRSATTLPRDFRHNKWHSARGASQETNALHMSIKLWALLADIDEMYCSMKITGENETLAGVEPVIDIYDRMIDYGVATARIINNCAKYLTGLGKYHESYRILEKGARQLEFPAALEVWLHLLTSFESREGFKKTERMRDYFETVLELCPPENSVIIFYLYADFEELNGSIRLCMDQYNKATLTVPDEEKLGVYDRYIAKATKYYGLSKTREIYEAAINRLPNQLIVDICSRFIRMEMRLGEVDRARSIYIHGSQYANPSKRGKFWSEWNEFEVQHGNQETFKEMLRIKRSVTALYQYDINYVQSKMGVAKENPELEIAEGNDMAKLEAAAIAQQASVKNTDEIDIDIDSDDLGDESGEDREEGEEDYEIDRVPVPADVFGGLQK